MLHVFVCPVRGVYVFQSALLAFYHEHVETDLVKEGNVLVEMYAAGSTAGHGFDQVNDSCFVPSFVLSFVISFVRSYVRSFICLYFTVSNTVKGV